MGERAQGPQGLVEAYGEMVGMRLSGCHQVLEYLTSKRSRDTGLVRAVAAEASRLLTWRCVRAAQARISRAIAGSALKRMRQEKVIGFR